MDPRAPGRAGRLRLGYLGLGSNEGDRLANLRAARDALARRGVEPVASSSVYETAPQGEVTDQPDFLNACLRIRTELDPEALLDVCKEVERELGRTPGGTRHGPRPGSAGRGLVPGPLLGLDPERRRPGGKPLKELLPAVLDQRVTPHAGGSWRSLVVRRASRGEGWSGWGSWRIS